MRGINKLLIATVAMGILFINTAQAASIVDAAYVAESVSRGALLWDVRNAADFQKGHIPGAVNIGDAGQVLRNPNTEDYIATDAIAKMLGDAGLDPAREIIVYATNGSPSAYFGLLTLEYFGYAQPKVFHGGVDAWLKDRHTLTDAIKAAAPLSLTFTPKTGVTVTTADVLARVKTGNMQFLDVRTPAEFKGEDIRAIRGGHIPGAINIPYERNWVDPETPRKLSRREVADSSGMALKDKSQLKALYATLDPSKETIVYCQSGVRAAETAAVLKDLGFANVKVYDSSWLGYGNTLEAPAEDVVFLNVGLLQGRISGLQNRIELLEKELAAAKSR